MPWRDILAAGGYFAGLYALRQGGGYPAVYKALQGHFPEESSAQIREAAKRAVAAFEAGASLGRAGRRNPLLPGKAPWLLGDREHPEGSPECRYRYEVTAEFAAGAGGETQWVTVRNLDSDRSLSPDELRELVRQTVGEWSARVDTLPGGGGTARKELVSMRVDFVFRC